jgi:phosphatidyl-myo-inositol dimannoside synthase
MKRSLLLTNDFPPVQGGISTVFHHIWKYFPHDRMRVLTPKRAGDGDFDRRADMHPIRFRAPSGGNAGKLLTLLLMSVFTAREVLFGGVRELHAGQILSCGPIGYAFQKLFGIPCFLWLYGGETTPSYLRRAPVKRLVETLVRGCRFLVTNSPATTREFLDYGIPPDRIVEIIPAVDSDVFRPGPKPETLAARHGLEGMKILLTVARLTPRKGHDLVLRSLSFLRDRSDLRYVVIGTGADRSRLDRLAGELGISDRVVFAGWVDESELPDYYRLADVFVMPNREETRVTDSIEGFGISFIEAAATGKPAIGGRSGGAVDAVVEGETGFIVDPDDPRELADRIAFLLDNPRIAGEMGRKGRDRVLRGFTWRQRAERLAASLTVPPFPLREISDHVGG